MSKTLKELERENEILRGLIEALGISVVTNPKSPRLGRVHVRVTEVDPRMWRTELAHKLIEDAKPIIIEVQRQNRLFVHLRNH